MIVYKSVLENENSGGLTVDSLQITSPATNTEFQISENFDTNGLVVTATIGRVVADVTIDCTFTPSIGTTFVDNDIGYQNVNIQYGGKTTSYQIRIKDRQAKIYGVQWNDTTSSRLARTDSAFLLSDPIPAVNNGNGSSPFDTIYPYSEIKVIEDPDVGILVSIPKYYYKWTNENEILSLQISEGEFEGSHVSPAHADRGDGVGERDVVYIGRYHCSETNYKSSSGVKPKVKSSRLCYEMDCKYVVSCRIC